MIYASNIKHKNIFLFQKRNKKKLLCYVLIHISYLVFLLTVKKSLILPILGKNKGFFRWFANSADTVHKNKPNKWYIHQTSNIKIFFCFKNIFLCLKFYVYITMLVFRWTKSAKTQFLPILGKNKGFFSIFANSADTVQRTNQHTWYIHQTSNIKKFFCFKKTILCFVTM